MTTLIENNGPTVHAMSVARALETRRAVRGYKSEGPMPDKEFERLMEGVLRSPTAFNVQNWRFVRVRDLGIRRAIREAARDQAQVTEASELVVICFDRMAWAKEPERYWKDAPLAAQEYAVPALRSYYGSSESVSRDEGLRSSSMAAMSLMLLATEMGYQTCPMTGFDFDAVRRILNLPADHSIGMMVAIGHQSKATYPRPGPLSLDEVLVTDRFGG